MNEKHLSIIFNLFSNDILIYIFVSLVILNVLYRQAGINNSQISCSLAHTHVYKGAMGAMNILMWMRSNESLRMRLVGSSLSDINNNILIMTIHSIMHPFYIVLVSAFCIGCHREPHATHVHVMMRIPLPFIRITCSIIVIINKYILYQIHH